MNSVFILEDGVIYGVLGAVYGEVVVLVVEITDFVVGVVVVLDSKVVI